MPKLVELFENYDPAHGSPTGQQRKIYLITRNYQEDVEFEPALIGIFLEEHKAKKAKRYLIKQSLEDMDADEDYETMHLYYSDVFQIHEVMAGRLNFDSAGYIINILDELK